ncbi:MAG: MATE family efflux transporter [Spirochaetes bacterium]|nr:MATE family efflux transporter [Spirochaetota bacterium]MBU1079683.1 MATE family efflux transporter [Spirochaetota bacterium]
MRDDTDCGSTPGHGLDVSRKGLFKALLNIAFPMMLGSAIEAVYNLTDAFFLGRLGTAEVGAPSIAFSIVFFLTVFGFGLSGAGMTLIAQSKGKGDLDRMNHYMNQSTSLLLCASVALAAIGALVAAPLLRLLNTPGEVYGFALVYMRIVFLGIPFTFAYFALQSSFTALGDSATPIKVHLLAVGLNVALDPVLIYGLGPIPAFGVAGAAIATVASQGVGAALSIAVLRRGRSGLRLSPAAMRPSGGSWALLLRIGLPSSVGQGLSAFGFTVLQGVVNLFGTSAIAAFGVGNRLMNMFDIPTHGIASATTSLVGRAMGAKDEKTANRVVRASLAMVVSFEIPLLALSFFYGGGLVRLFVADPEAIRLGDLMFKVVSPSLLMFGLYFALSGAFQGAGDTKVIMALSVFRLWVVRVPIAYFLAYGTKIGPLSIWVAMFVSNFLTAAIGFAYFKSGRWKRALDPDRI